MGKKTRILPYLLRSGRFSDSGAVKKALSEGKVKVGDRVVTSPSFEFRPSTHTVSMNGKKITARVEQITIMLHKPEGVICQKNDREGRRNVWQWLMKHSPLKPEEVRGLATVGRLDIGTRGLLLLTSDGDFVNRINQPKVKIPKKYAVHAEGYLSDASIRNLQSGVRIPLKQGGKRVHYQTLPARVGLRSRDKDGSRFIVTIVEGKKRQVRLMCAAVGNPVVDLQRVAVGGLSLGRLKEGEMRLLSEKDICALFSADRH